MNEIPDSGVKPARPQNLQNQTKLKAPNRENLELKLIILAYQKVILFNGRLLSHWP